MNVGLYDRWLATLGGGERYSLSIAEYLSREHAVTVLSHAPVDASQAGERLGLDLGRVNFVRLDPRPPAQMTPVTADYDFFINASHWDYFPSLAKRSAMVVFFPLRPPDFGGRMRYRLGRLLMDERLSQATRPITTRLSPGLATRLENLIPPDFLDSVASYELLWSISDFVQQWTLFYWNRESELLYPPVGVDAFRPRTKEPRILSVGRFFHGAHNKKHAVMISAFRQMVDEGLEGWELHLAGGTQPETIHQRYLDKLKRMARGYPITLHTDMPRNELTRLYETSAIYWHAAGYGEDEARAPHALEHFGITTVEAMAAGCVPVVYGSGGQPELVEDGRTGFLWYTSADLMGHTRRLMADETLRAQMGAHAVQASRRFDQAHFEERLRESLVEYGL
jgi:glycosyltransferase involved in cell wall biosynthesis